MEGVEEGRPVSVVMGRASLIQCNVLQVLMRVFFFNLLIYSNMRDRFLGLVSGIK